MEEGGWLAVGQIGRSAPAAFPILLQGLWTFR
jgi:hypothetical protein